MARFVEFEKFCETCIHCEKSQDEEPCDICLAEPARDDGSRKPTMYEEWTTKPRTCRHGKRGIE